MMHHSRYEARILRVLAHIDADPDGDLSLDRLAEVAAMARFYWHRVYVAMTGETASRTIRRRRLMRASARLQESDRTLDAVAVEAGYGTARSFAGAFRAEFGLSPTAFRAEGRRLPQRFLSLTAK